MATLDDFTAQEKALLVPLPYRVGLWVSQSDTTGGDEADEAEMQALEAVVVAFAEDFLKSSFVEDLMRETRQQKDRWPEWQADVARIPEECRQAIDILKDKMSVREVTAFKHNLTEIGVDVAMAFCEVDLNSSLAIKIGIYSRYYMGRLKAYFTKEAPPALGEIINISRQEEKALNILKKSLRYDEQDGLPPEPVDYSAASESYDEAGGDSLPEAGDDESPEARNISGGEDSDGESKSTPESV